MALSGRDSFVICLILLLFIRHKMQDPVSRGQNNNFSYGIIVIEFIVAGSQHGGSFVLKLEIYLARSGTNRSCRCFDMVIVRYQVEFMMQMVART